MAAMSKDEILSFYEELRQRPQNRDRADTNNFCDFLKQLFNERELDGCTFFTSMNTFCIVRFPTYREWQFAPMLSLRIASSHNVWIRFRIFESTKPILRFTEESSSTAYDLAMQEFDRRYEQFLAAHEPN